jgi:hypothetical protein
VLKIIAHLAQESITDVDPWEAIPKNERNNRKDHDDDFQRENQTF